MKKGIIQINNILTKEQLKKDYEDLRSLNAIAKKYNISMSVIRNKFKKYDIPYVVVRYKSNHNIFSEESERSFYLAGFIAADGCVRISKTNKNRDHINHRIVIALSKKDLDVLEMCKALLDSENPIGTYISKKTNPKWKDSEVVKLSITSKQMVKDLEKFNIGPRKTHTHTIPKWLIDHPLLHHYIRGYVDGDGSFWISSDIENTRMTFSLRGTISFLEIIKNILNKNCGIETGSKPRMSNGQGQFSVHSNVMVSKIVDFLYKDATIFMQRKYDKAIKAKQILEIKEEMHGKIQKILGR